MRLTSLTHLLTAVLLPAFLLSACGSSDNETSTNSSSASSVPPIVQGIPNPVNYDQGEFLNAFSFVNDEVNNRWLIADRSQGVIAIEKTSGTRSLLVPIANENNNSHLQAISDLVIDTNTNTLYMLDLKGEQIVSANGTTGLTTPVAAKDDFSVEDKFNWANPFSLFFDHQNNRLLIGDSDGLIDTTVDEIAFSAFSVFIYSPETNSISVMAPALNIANPIVSSLALVRDFYYEASDDQLYLSTAFRGSNTSFFYSLLNVDVATWTPKTLFIDLNTPVGRTSSAHSITYDKASNQAFMINSISRVLVALNINSIGSPEGEPEDDFTVVMSFDEQDYPVTRPSHVALSAAGELFIFDEKTNAIHQLDYDINAQPEADSSAKRILQLSGGPLSKQPTERPQTIEDIEVDSSQQNLIITDRASNQRDAFSYSSQQFNIFEFDVDVTDIAPDTLTLEEGDEIDFSTRPKPAYISYDKTTGDLVILAFGFAEPTTNPLVYNTYRTALYRRVAGEDKAKPVSFLENENMEKKLINFPFDVTNTRKLAATAQGVYFGLNDTNSTSSSLWFWNEIDKTLERVINNTPFIPRELNGLVYDTTNKRILFIDSFHDALIEVNEGGEERVFTVISGRENTTDLFLSLPTGLVINNDSQIAYTFDNSIRALVSINLTTGQRTRIDGEPNLIRSADKLALSADNTQLFITDKRTNRIVAMDIATGAQRWIDKP